MAYRTIYEGDYFGDYEVIHNMMRVNAAMARSKCNMLYITKNIYKKYIEKDYPELEAEMRYKAKHDYDRTQRYLNTSFEVVKRNEFRLNLKSVLSRALSSPKRY